MMDVPNKQPQAPAPATPEKKKIEPVASGVKQVKRPASRRFFDTLFAESPKPLVAKIGHDVIVPRLKSGLEAAFNEFLAGILWGDSANRPTMPGMGRTVLRGGIVNYAGMSQAQTPESAARLASATKSTGNYQDLVVPTQEMAQTILAEMIQLMNQYRVVTVGDLYELADITPQISDNGFGWTSLDNSRISRVRDGFLLELPRPSVI